MAWLLLITLLLPFASANDEAALLKAIIAHPAEDTPRLMYADWLAENGQPERAEFIRVQVEFAQLRVDDPRRGTLKERAQKLLSAHFDKFLPKDFRTHIKWPNFQMDWERGFPGILTFKLSALSDGNVRQALDQLPLAAGFQATLSIGPASERRQELENLSRLSLSQRIGSLHLNAGIHPAPPNLELEPLAQLYARLPNLRGLGFGHFHVSPPLMDQLIASPLASRLTTFAAHDLSVNAARRLVSSGKFLHLKSLDTGPRYQIMDLWGASPLSLPALKKLSLYGGPLQAADRFFATRVFRQLHELEIGAQDRTEALLLAQRIAATANDLVALRIVVGGEEQVPLPASTLAMLERNRTRFGCDRVIRAVSDTGGDGD